MRKNLDGSSPVGVEVLARRLGICHATLQRADSELYAKTVATWSQRRGRRKAATRMRGKRIRARQSALRARLAQALEWEFRSDAPRSASAVAFDAGVHPTLLKHYCPEGYRRLVELGMIARSQHRQTLRHAIEQEIRAPQPRTVSALASALHVCSGTLARAFPSLVADLRAVAKPAPRRPRRQRPRPGDDTVLAVLEAELRSSSPRSLRALSREHDIHHYTFSRVAPSAVERLVALRAAKRSSQDARLRARIVPALEAALRRPDPPSTAALARHLGLSPHLLKRLAPALYRELMRRRDASGLKTRPLP